MNGIVNAKQVKESNNIVPVHRVRVVNKRTNRYKMDNSIESNAIIYDVIVKFSRSKTKYNDYNAISRNSCMNEFAGKSAEKRRQTNGKNEKEKKTKTF